MSDDWVDEIPASRVQIALEVDTAGARERKELPLRMLVLNKFSTKQGGLPIEERLAGDGYSKFTGSCYEKVTAGL